MPEVFEFQNKKYDWRREVQETVVPGLGKWNDVIHLTPIEPFETVKELKEAGVWKKWNWKAYKINPNDLDQSKLVIMTSEINNYPDNKHSILHFEPFSIKLLKENSHLPDVTKLYYRDCKKKNKNPLIYVYATHVLYKGTIDTTNLEIVEV